MISNTFAANTIRLAKVTYVHPEGQKLEVMFLDTGDYGRDVQVMSPYAGTDFGFTSGIPSPEQEGHEPNKKTDPNERHIIAVVATLQGRHICLGFLFPQVTHMAFTKDQDKNRMIERHTSDFYRTVNDAADMDMVHPALAGDGMPKVFIRVGTGPFPAVLAGRDYDNRFALKRNLLQPAMITLASPFGILLAGGKETVAVGVAASAASSVASGSSAMSGTALMSETLALPAVDWIAEAAMADAEVPCVDEDNNGICDDLEKIQDEHTNTFHLHGGGCNLRTKKGRLNMTSFVFKTKKATLSITEDQINAYVGGSSGIKISEDKIVLQMGDRKLELSEDGITLNVGDTMLQLTDYVITLIVGMTMLKLTEAGIITAGDMTTAGVHTDANGTHGGEGGGVHP